MPKLNRIHVSGVRVARRPRRYADQHVPPYGHDPIQPTSPSLKLEATLRRLLGQREARRRQREEEVALGIAEWGPGVAV